MVRFPANPLNVRLPYAAIAVLALLLVRAATADDAAPATAEQATRFLRILRSMENQPLALQTSIVRYVPEGGEGEIFVDLIGVVHVGDSDYYKQLNKRFEAYDAVLYELVADPQDRVPTREQLQQAEGFLATLQRIGPTLLALESQMDHIDYTKENLVHADLSPDEMGRIIKERGDDPRTLFLGVVADLLRQGNLEKLRETRAEKDLDPAQGLDPFQVLMDPSGSKKLKLALAAQFTAQSDLSGQLGPTLGTILIEDRNKAAMKVLGKELAKGSKRIGIFYGAAHMPDFERSLRNDFGMKRESCRWLTAWDLRLRGKGPVMQRLFRSLLE